MSWTPRGSSGCYLCDELGAPGERSHPLTLSADVCILLFFFTFPTLLLCCRSLEDFEMRRLLYHTPSTYVVHAVDRVSKIEVALKMYKRRKLNSFNL
jgi:hypothetical protein